MVRFILAAKLLLGSCVVFGAVSVLTMACSAGGAGHGSGLSGGSAGGGGAGAGMLGSARADEGGTRLRPNAITGEDGSKHYVGTFRDKTRNEDCSFTTLADGSIRCVPPMWQMKMAEVAYADAQCTQLLAGGTSSCGPAPKYLGITDDCGAVTAVYAFGPAYSGAQIWLKDGGGQCLGYQRGPNDVFIAAAANVAFSSFAAGTVGPE